MLTGKLVRVRHAGKRIVPIWLDMGSAEWLAVAAQLLSIVRGHGGRSRAELDAEVEEACGDSPEQLVYRGLAKLLEDRCDFEVDSGLPPEQIREAVFRIATQKRQAPGVGIAPGAFDRTAVLAEAATLLNLPADKVEQGLFADLKSEQRMLRFEDITAERLLERYNVALAQAVLLVR